MAHKGLLRLDPETAHNILRFTLAHAQESDAFLRWLSRASQKQTLQYTKVPVHVFGIDFPGTVGLPAGFDKTGELGPSVQAMGFSWYGVGTVTPRPQKGNPRPRIFRDGNGNLVNAMGFNNPGVHAVERNLSRVRPKVTIPVIGSVGPNKDSVESGKLDRVIADFIECLDVLSPHCDLMEINMSSPNTPGLRDNLGTQRLGTILDAVQRRATKPFVVKLSPDMHDDDVPDAIDTAYTRGAAGLSIGNTSVSVPLEWPGRELPKGGRSGEVLWERAKMLVHRAHTHKPEFPIIGIGGVSSTGRVSLMKIYGASLVGIYSAFVYQGPTLIHDAEWMLSLEQPPTQ